MDYGAVAPGEPHHGYTDQAEHVFRYALYPHPGDPVAAQVARAGYELNIPLRRMPVAAHPGPRPGAASFLADRRSPTIYQELRPGVATTLAVQQEIVDRIRGANAEHIVCVAVWEPCEPNQSAVSSGITYLDDYIRARYEPCSERGAYRIYRKIGR